MDISKKIAELKTIPGFRENVGMILVHNGDLTWGRKYPSELVSTRTADQLLIAVANLEPWGAYPNMHTVRLVHGTDSHAFGEGALRHQLYLDFAAVVGVHHLGIPGVVGADQPPDLAVAQQLAQADAGAAEIVGNDRQPARAVRHQRIDQGVGRERGGLARARPAAGDHHSSHCPRLGPNDCDAGNGARIVC